jgi:cytochrome oxidase assembly protein ShyY1
LLALLAATISLGNWQRHRAEEKESLRAQYDRAASAPPIQLAATATDASALRFHRVRATGEFDASGQILIDNKVRAGQPGYHVVAPLKMAGGGVVLVDRGWVAAGPRRSELPQAPPPTGIVTVDGCTVTPAVPVGHTSTLTALTMGSATRTVTVPDSAARRQWTVRSRRECRRCTSRFNDAEISCKLLRQAPAPRTPLFQGVPSRWCYQQP